MATSDPPSNSLPRRERVNRNGTIRLLSNSLIFDLFTRYIHIRVLSVSNNGAHFGPETREREIGGFEFSGIDSRCRRKTVPEIEQADGASAATEQAEDRTRETRGFMRSVRRATRRKYTSEEKIRIVLEGFRRETTVSDLCRREGINPANYYS